ncbi:biotin carboxylase [Tistrella bauzanensis]
MPMPVAVLYQALPPPSIGGVRKPAKPGGYADSGADIAVALRRAGVAVVTPVATPRASHDRDWVFGDDAAGIAAARAAGAQVLWANTVLYRDHPISEAAVGMLVVGQHPARMEQLDDKFATNAWLRGNGLPVVPARLIAAAGVTPAANPGTGPVVLGLGAVAAGACPRRMGMTGSDGRWWSSRCAAVAARGCPGGRSGRLAGGGGGQSGVRAVWRPADPGAVPVRRGTDRGGDAAGDYVIGGALRHMRRHWSLPPVLRHGHDGGIAPYSGNVAVAANSRVATPDEAAAPALRAVADACAAAGDLVGSRAVIRIDARADAAGRFLLFDLNTKPNLTGAGRPGRDDQDSLVVLAGQGIGWSYGDLLTALIGCAWRMPG